MTIDKRFTVLFFVPLVLLAAAGTPVPYVTDAHTLHLYHFDGNAADAVSVSPLNLTLSGATVSSLSYTDFGTALNTTASNAAVAYIDEQPVNSFVGADGAFTFEAIVKPMVAANAIANHMEIMSGEDEDDAGRAWQFRIDTSGRLEFNNILVSSNRFLYTLPSWTVGSWYHAAVTYNGQAGTAGNLKFYWTSLDAAPDEAVLVASFTMSADIPDYAIDFAVGNEARNTPGESFEGLVDEVRISSIARTSGDMIFVPSPFPRPGIIAHPSGTTVHETQTASFETVFESDSTPAAQWFKVDPAGDIELTSADPDISINTTYDAGMGQYTTVLHIASASVTSDTGSYYCKVNNDSNQPRSTNHATLTVFGLTARWTLDQADFTAGQYMDNVGGRGAAVAGTPVFVAGAGGVANSAVVITPESGWATIDAFNPSATGQLTISQWAKWQQTPSAVEDIVTGDFAGLDSITALNSISSDRWRHICIVFDGTTGKLYINGILRAQGPFTLPADTTSELHIGSAVNGQETFNGFLDDVRIYNFALTGAHVLSIYSQMAGGCGLAYDFSGPSGVPDCTLDFYDLLVVADEWLSPYEYTDLAQLSGGWHAPGL